MRIVSSRRRRTGRYPALAPVIALLIVIIGVRDTAAQVLDDDQLLAAMIATAVAHDLGIPIGLLPFPVTQLVGESVQYSGNIALKAYRPWLKPPPNVTRFPNDDGDTDACSFTFYLPNNAGTYENMFGIIPIRAPYYDASSNTHFLWKDRWGILGAPRLYHANTSVRLNVRSAGAVRRFDPATGAFHEFDVPFSTTGEKTELYYPIRDAWSPLPDVPRAFGIRQVARADGDGQVKVDGPQQVYLPIGSHTMEWTAATQLNTITDVIVPGVLLAMAVHTEIKTARAGLKAAKKVKNAGGIGDNIVDAADNAVDVQDAQKAAAKFDSIWEAFFTKKEPGPIGRQVREAAVKKFRGVMADLLDKVLGLGVTVLDAETGAFLESQGQISEQDRRWLDIMYKVAVQQNLNTGLAVLKVFISGGSSKDYIANVIVALLKTWGLDQFVTFDTGISGAGQTVTIWDDVPPRLSIDPAPVILEATDFGGTRRYRVIDELRERVMAGASDNCGRVPVLDSDTPELLPIGDLVITWTASDQGPNPDDGQDYAPQAVQNVSVRDTQPPLLLAPPSKVIEATAAVGLEDAAIGQAVAVDLADVQPVVTNDAPASFPVDARNEIRWTATDSSGNSAEAPQWVTVKTTGTNTAPVADDNTATTLTAEPVDIRLTAFDADELDGMRDPLWFSIEQQPGNGEFVAPLYPFFINDYRTRPNDGLPDFDPVSHDLGSYIQTNYCEAEPQLAPPVDFVHNARYVHVTDEGLRYLLDEYWECDPFEDKSRTQRRFSKWDSAGNFLAQMRLDTVPESWPKDDVFVIDRDGYLYYSRYTSAGSSSELFLNRCEVDFTAPNGDPNPQTSQECLQAYKFENSSTPDDELDVGSLSYARIDSGTNAIYVADADSILVFETLESGGTRFIGEAGPRDADGALVADWLGDSPALEVGSDGSLYVADVEYHRIHKIGPVTVDADGELVPGEYIGWSGRCTGSGNKACDDDRQRSRGYSCTYEADSCTVAPADRAGAGQGQFDTPRFIAIDPHDVLYVADYQNERVQRLSIDGSFAGEAVSDGSGINKGDRPSFVLGNMGKPESLSVNSSQFYVVDRDEQFVHVFGTLPFKDLTNDAATVTYVSDQDFHGAVDAFTFSVSDGLADSAPATVSVMVNRNHRAPLALGSEEAATEDTPLALTLQADDPDGILGKDFNGLDTLTYSVLSPPAHGALTGTAPDLTYTPDADFFGEDAFTFRVNDGLFDSEPATVSLTVEPVNDAPVLTLEVPERVALGFPTLVTSTFTDDPSDGYEATILWGDGTAEATGQITDDGEEPRIDGIAVSAPPLPDIEGRTYAQHTYATPGPKTVRVCVVDSGTLPGCDTVVIQAEPLVSLGVGGSVYTGPLGEDEITELAINDDEAFTYELSFVNALPSVGAGLPAAEVAFTARLPGKVAIGDIAVDRGTCTRTGLDLSCAFGELEPGAEVTLTIEAAGPGNLIYDEYRDLEGVLTTTSPALEPEMTILISTELLADSTDSDGDGMSDVFESAYALDNTSHDAAGDADGDGLDNLSEYELGTSPLATDSDSDGLSDFEEASSGLTDPANGDTDGDGIADGWELDNGLDPANGSDADLDADGDGATNLEEYQSGGDPQRDDVPPQLVTPPDVAVDATGALTDVAIGTASALDGKDGTVTAAADWTGPFPPGANVVTWTATDAAGNRAEAMQRVDVTPLVDFGVARTVPEGVRVEVPVQLNGSAVEYPVVVPYTISGTAGNPSDHDAVDGAVLIESGVAGGVPISIVKDRTFESDETIVLTMGSPVNAVPGGQVEHVLTISEPNVPPEVTIRIEQGGHPVTTAYVAGGLLAVTAEVRDNPGDLHSFDWSASDPSVLDPVAARDAGYLIDASLLDPGFHRLRVVVADDATPPGVTAIDTLLKIEPGAARLSDGDDSDGDGTGDATEGYADRDGDRLPDYLDDLANANMLRLADDGRILETNPGLGLRLGETAFTSGERYAALAEELVQQDIDHGFPNDVIDFEVTGLESGGTADVVVPLRYPVSAGARWRKFAEGLWRDLAAGTSDGIASAPGAGGACPPPGSPAYGPLSPGHSCLELTLTDGGPNDGDGTANTIVRDPGGLAVPIAASLEALPVADRTVTRGSVVMLRLRLHSDSGDVVVRSLRLRASGSGDDAAIDFVRVVRDENANGDWDAGEPVLGTGIYAGDDGTLDLRLLNGFEIPFGSADLLVVYELN